MLGRKSKDTLLLLAFIVILRIDSNRSYPLHFQVHCSDKVHITRGDMPFLLVIQETSSIPWLLSLLNQGAFRTSVSFPKCEPGPVHCE